MYILILKVKHKELLGLSYTYDIYQPQNLDVRLNAIRDD